MSTASGHLLGRLAPVALRLVLWGFGLYLLYGAAMTLRYWAAVIAFPGEIDFVEGISVYESRMLLQGRDLYPAADAAQFTGAIYGPLFYVLGAIALCIVPDSFVAVRLLALAGVLTMAACFAFAVLRVRRSALALIVAVALALFPTSIVALGVAFKPDSIYLGPVFVGLLIAMRRFEDRGVFYSIPFFVLALYLKPSALAAPAAVALALLLRDWRTGLRYCGLGFAASAVLLGSFWWAFGKEMLVHMLLNNVAEYNLQAALVSNPVGFVYFFYPLIALAAVFSLLFGQHRILVAYLLFAFVLQIMVFGGKLGSWINYWHEPSLALALMAAIGFARFEDGQAPVRPFWRRIQSADENSRLVPTVAVLLVLVLFCAVYKPRHGKNTPGKEMVARVAAVDATIDELLRTSDERGCAQVYASNPSNVIRHGGRICIPVTDTFLYVQHILSGRNDGAHVARGIAEQKYVFIVLNTRSDYADPLLLQHIAPAHMQLVLKHYRKHREIPGTTYSEGDVHFFVPRERGSR